MLLSLLPRNFSFLRHQITIKCAGFFSISKVQNFEIIQHYQNFHAVCQTTINLGYHRVRDSDRYPSKRLLLLIIQLDHHWIMVRRQAMYILTEVQLLWRSTFLAYLTTGSLCPITIGQDAILVHLKLVGNKDVVDATVCQ